MGFKTLKWLYDLGVQHERSRLASYLRNAQSQHQDDMFQIEQALAVEDWDKTKDNIRKKAQQRLEFKHAVDAEVIRIIDGMFRREEKITYGSSMIYLEREK